MSCFTACLVGNFIEYMLCPLNKAFSSLCPNLRPASKPMLRAGRALFALECWSLPCPTKSFGTIALTRSRGKCLTESVLSKRLIAGAWPRYDRMHLHVNLDDEVADGLYDSMGYKSLEQYDAPRWMRVVLGMPLIRCKVKGLRSRGQTEGSL